MSNKQRPAWRPWAFVLVLMVPVVCAITAYWYTTDRSARSLVLALHGVAVSMWFILLGAAWLRAQKQQSKALRHAITMRSRPENSVASSTSAAVERALLRAKDDLATVAVMWHALFILFGLLSLLLHFKVP